MIPMDETTAVRASSDRVFAGLVLGSLRGGFTDWARVFWQQLLSNTGSFLPVFNRRRSWFFF
jgi:hypothetical protein